MVNFPFIGNTEQLEETTIGLIFTNFITLLLAIFSGLTIIQLTWVYWSESIIIGVFTILTFIKQAIRDEKNRIANIAFGAFFLIHYGLFHFGYAIFLLGGSLIAYTLSTKVAGPILWSDMFPLNEVLSVLLSVAVLGIGHLYSFIKNVLNKEILEQSILARAFIGPYARILPMHFTIIISGFIFVLVGYLIDIYLLNLILVFLFVSLKTIMDIGSHKVKYNFIAIRAKLPVTNS